MKVFEMPMVSVEKIEVEDVIATSSIVPGGGNGSVGGEIFDD